MRQWLEKVDGAAPCGIRVESHECPRAEVFALRYFLGVDGGTSRSAAALVDESGRVVGQGSSGPTYAGGGRDHPRAAEHLREAVSGALAGAGAAAGQVACTYLACSNWWGASKHPEAEAALRPLGLGGTVIVSAHSDLLSPWGAAGCPDPAVIIVLGTFWGGCGWKEGRYWRHILDQASLDLTSAMWAQGETIGTSGLIAAIRSRLGGPETSLFGKLTSLLAGGENATDGAAQGAGADNGAEALAAWAAAHEVPRERAALARAVAAAAAEGDAVAIGIYRQAGDGVAEAIIAQGRYMGMASRQFTAVLSGNVLEAGEPLLAPLRERVSAALPRAVLQINREDPAVGAALLARRAAEGAPYE
jgi:N-acetylglucosamine kinase-like BadF-type ATPase